MQGAVGAPLTLKREVARLKAEPDILKNFPGPLRAG